MDKINKYVEAYKLAEEAHKGQLDKGGNPYIEHPVRVAQMCKSLEAKTAAMLHDVIEDTSLTEDDLYRAGFDEKIVQTVVDLTRKDGETYMDFIRRLSANELAREVKIADLHDNMDVSRLNDIKENDVARLKKYLKAFKYLKKI